MNQKKNIVIINSVPLNGGDEALLRSTIIALKKKNAYHSIKVLCNNPIFIQKYINDIEFDWDWEYAFMKADLNEGNSYRIKKRVRVKLQNKFGISFHNPISRLLASRREKRVYRLLKNADKIIVSAGGYFHDFYNYDERVKTLHFIAHHLKKPYIIFFQSLGPFWKKKHYSQLLDIFDKAEKIILREEFSLRHLELIEYHCKNVQVSNDIAFHLYYNYSLPVKVNRKIKKIALNFREWPFEQESEDNLQKARHICKYLLSLGCELTFLSTCQGIDDYRDDSVFAEKIIKTFSTSEQSNCFVLKEKYSLTQLIKIYHHQDAYIGMRLHGAILSLISGVPVINIAYEDKTLGIFKLLGLSKYCFSYKENKQVWLAGVKLLIWNYDEYLKEVTLITKKAASKVDHTLEEIF